jgi:excisionase family DNA binding protein
MNNITADHLSRAAYVYVRQSTPGQLINNPESRRRQYGLVDRAKALGWEHVVVVDEDLGHSGSGTIRSGFDCLLAAVCTGTAGAVFAIECSRFARNGREWHTLLEFCAFVNCLIVDEDGVYDPKLTNDRLVLGLKGTFSEFELSILRQRSLEALRLKAARGDLHRTVAVGYVRSKDNRIELEPDKRVRDAIGLAFRKFQEFGSIRQVSLWLIDEGIKMPIVVYGPQGRIVEWQLPRYNTIYRILTNPIYAGVYAYGRTGSKVRLEGGHKVITRDMRRPQADWNVLIRDHHEAYVSWEEYERNQKIISGNATRKGEIVPGSVRNGGGLLVGLLRCGHCGRKLRVHGGAKGAVRYECNDARINHGARTSCIAFSNLRIDSAVSDEVLRVIAPLGLDAALQTITDRKHAGTEQLRQRELALEQARYEAARAHRQYNAVEPENRLIVADLERRWNERLEEVVRLEEELRIAREQQPAAITEIQRSEIFELAAELPRLWNHPSASAATRKRILRAVLEEIIVTVAADRLLLKLHWKGGDHTELRVAKNRVGQTRWTISAETEQLIRDLARLGPDKSITAILNRLGLRTGKGLTWTQERVKGFRKDHQIAVYRDGERAARGEVVLHEAATRLSVSKMTVVRLIRDGVLPAKQVCIGAPYVIRELDLDLPEVKRAIGNANAVSADPRQGTLDYQ